MAEGATASLPAGSCCGRPVRCATWRKIIPSFHARHSCVPPAFGHLVGADAGDSFQPLASCEIVVPSVISSPLNCVGRSIRPSTIWRSGRSQPCHGYQTAGTRSCLPSALSSAIVSSGRFNSDRKGPSPSLWGPVWSSIGSLLEVIFVVNRRIAFCVPESIDDALRPRP